MPRTGRIFLSAMGSLLAETKTACYAWALLPNYAHFLFRTGEVSRRYGDDKIARRLCGQLLGMTTAGVGYAVQRGEVMVRERRYQLTP